MFFKKHSHWNEKPFLSQWYLRHYIHRFAQDRRSRQHLKKSLSSLYAILVGWEEYKPGRFLDISSLCSGLLPSKLTTFIALMITISYYIVLETFLNSCFWAFYHVFSGFLSTNSIRTSLCSIFAHCKVLVSNVSCFADSLNDLLRSCIMYIYQSSSLWAGPWRFSWSRLVFFFASLDVLLVLSADMQGLCEAVTN